MKGRYKNAKLPIDARHSFIHPKRVLVISLNISERTSVRNLNNLTSSIPYANENVLLEIVHFEDLKLKEQSMADLPRLGLVRQTTVSKTLFA